MTAGMLSAAALLTPVVVMAALYIRGMNEAAGLIAGQDIELMQTSDQVSLSFLEARRSEKNFLLFRDSVYLNENRAALARIADLCIQGRKLAPRLAHRFDVIINVANAYSSLADSLVRLPQQDGNAAPNLQRLRQHHQDLLDAAAAATEPALRDSLLAAAAQVGAELGLPIPAGRLGLVLNDSIRSLQNALSAQTDSIVLFAREQVRTHQRRARSLAAWGQRNLITALLVVLVILAWLIFTLPKRAVLPIKRITNAIRRVEEGDLNVRITIRSRDELAELARRLNLALARLREFDERKTDRILHLERRFRLLSQDISEGVLVVDKTPNVVLANPAMELLLGCPPADAAGRKLRSFPNLKFLHEPLERILAGASSTQTCEIPVELPGSAVCIEAMRDRSGNVTGALVVVTNPTPPQPSEDETPESPAQPASD